MATDWEKSDVTRSGNRVLLYVFPLSETAKCVRMLSKKCGYNFTYFNLLKTKRNLLYIRNQSVPHSKHFPSRL